MADIRSIRKKTGVLLLDIAVNLLDAKYGRRY